MQRRSEFSPDLGQYSQTGLRRWLIPLTFGAAFSPSYGDDRPMDEYVPGANSNSTPPPPPPPPHPAPPAEPLAGDEPGKKGMSTGAKFFIGCLGVLALMSIVGIVLAYAVFNVVGDRVQDFAGGVERQQEAQETLVRLQREHSFDQPSDGVVNPAQAETFFEVTEELWDEMRPWADELADMALRMEERDEPSITDMAAGFRTMGRFVEGRLVFADAMDRHNLSAHEYLWTGMSLIRAYEELDRAEERRTVPPENIRLAQQHRNTLEEIQRASSEGRPDRGAVFHLSMIWGMTDGSAWRAMGLDTLMHDYR